MTRIRLWHSAIVVLASLAFHAASADDIKLKYRLLEKGTVVEVDVPADAQALVWQRKDSSTKSWIEHSVQPMAGPVSELRIPSPEQGARKSAWRLFARVSESSSASFPPSFFQGTRVFTGVSVDDYKERYSISYDSWGATGATANSWRTDRVLVAPGYLLQYDSLTSKLVVASDQAPNTPLSQISLSTPSGSTLALSIEDEKLHVLKILNHLREARVFGSQETWPSGFDRTQPPTYVWEIYDASKLPELPLISSSELSLDLDAAMLDLLQRGGLSASIAWPQPGIAAVLVNHSVTMSAGWPAFLPQGIREPASDDLPARANAKFFKSAVIKRMLRDPYQTNLAVGAGGKVYEYPSYYTGGSTITYTPFPGYQPPHPASSRSCPIFFTVDCRNASSPIFSDPLPMGDRRTIRTSELFSADGVVAVGFETVESHTVVRSAYVKIREPYPVSLVRSYLQVIDVSKDAVSRSRSLVDLPGRIRAITRFTPSSALLWTTSSGEYGWDLQASAYSGADVFLLSRVYAYYPDSIAAIGNDVFVDESRMVIRRVRLDAQGVLGDEKEMIHQQYFTFGGLSVVDGRLFTWQSTAARTSTVLEFDLPSFPSLARQWELEYAVPRDVPPVAGEDFLAIPKGDYGVEMLADE